MDLRPPNACMPPPLALLRERVVSAIDTVKFYADLYRPYGDPPLDLAEFIEWYSLLPVVSRTDFEEVSVEDRVSAAYASAPLVRKQTSGSTGIPLVIFIDEKVASFRSWRFRRPHFEAGEASPTSLEFLFPGAVQARQAGARGRNVGRQGRVDPDRALLFHTHRRAEIAGAHLQRSRRQEPGNPDRLCELHRQARRVDGFRTSPPLGEADLDDIGDAHA